MVDEDFFDGEIDYPDDPGFWAKGSGAVWTEAIAGQPDRVQAAKPQAAKPARSEKEQREADLALLRAVVDFDDDCPSAFVDMLDNLVDEDRCFETLSPKQRKWVDGYARENGLLPEQQVPASAVPVGRPVPTPAVLQNRPLQPPRRGSANEPAGVIICRRRSRRS